MCLPKQSRIPLPRMARGRRDITSDDYEDAREAALANIQDVEDEELYSENYMREIMDRGEKGDKREVTFLLAEGLESNRLKLRMTVLTILANSSERLGVDPFNPDSFL